MYGIIVGGGKVGLNLTRELLDKGQEVTLIEQRRDRYLAISEELEHVVQYGDGTELWVLERAGIQRADLVVAVTGDDEDNILICQIAREKYLVESIIARVNNPRNGQYFKLLGIQPAVSATDLILRLIEHEVPEYGLVHLLDLPGEQLEIIEVEVTAGAPAAGCAVSDLNMPDGSLVISVLRRDGGGFVPKADTVIEAGDEVLVVPRSGPRVGRDAAVLGLSQPPGRVGGEHARRRACSARRRASTGPSSVTLWRRTGGALRGRGECAHASLSRSAGRPHARDRRRHPRARMPDPVRLGGDEGP